VKPRCIITKLFDDWLVDEPIRQLNRPAKLESKEGKEKEKKKTTTDK